MEAVLTLWIEDHNQKRVPLSGAIIPEKAKRVYAHFKEPDGDERTDGGFQTSEGWFNKSKVSLQNIKIVGEVASADASAATYPEEFIFQVNC